MAAILTIKVSQPTLTISTEILRRRNFFNINLNVWSHGHTDTHTSEICFSLSSTKKFLLALLAYPIMTDTSLAGWSERQCCHTRSLCSHCHKSLCLRIQTPMSLITDVFYCYVCYLDRGSRADSDSVNLPRKTVLERGCVIKIIAHFITGGKGAKRIKR